MTTENGRLDKMRFLGIGDCADLASLYLRLANDGHDVKVFIGHPLCQDTLAGFHINRVKNWELELEWIRAAGEDGCVLFENIAGGRGELQDRLRQSGFRVIGSSGYGARLENDRGYAQRALAELGLSTAAVFEFSDTSKAIGFINKRPGRYVLKSNGTDTPSFTGRHPSGKDVQALLAAGDKVTASSFILMDHIDGVEMGVGAYFNGHDFLQPACLDWEHKRFFPGDLGELTGEMGTVVTYSRTKSFFERTLSRMRPLLRENGYCGYINLNTMVNERGIWPLEFTCRFGYPGYAILDVLQRTSWAILFKSMLNRSTLEFETEPGFAVGIVITTPPFPYYRDVVREPVGLPILFDGALSPEEQVHLHYGEMGLRDNMLVTTGMSGYTLVVTGTGQTIEMARDMANKLAGKIILPNARYRRDIGTRLIEGEWARIESLGVLDPLDGIAEAKV
jgi:phosphoribosylamine---glycine ligase